MPMPHFSRRSMLRVAAATPVAVAVPVALNGPSLTGSAPAGAVRTGPGTGPAGLRSEEIPSPPGLTPRPVGLLDDGTAVVNLTAANGLGRPFIWHDGSLRYLGLAGAHSAEVQAVGRRSGIAGVLVEKDGRRRLARWVNARAQSFAPDLPGRAVVLAVNNTGDVLVGWSEGDSGPVTEHVVVTLDGRRLQVGQQMAGNGTAAALSDRRDLVVDGLPRAWTAPAPGSTSMPAAALASVGAPAAVSSLGDSGWMALRVPASLSSSTLARGRDGQAEPLRLPAAYTIAGGGRTFTNDAGQVLALASGPGGTVPVLWDASGAEPVPLRPPSGIRVAELSGFNATGALLGRAENGRSYVGSGSGWVELRPPSGSPADVRAGLLNDSGEVLGTYGTGAQVRAAVWRVAN